MKKRGIFETYSLKVRITNEPLGQTKIADLIKIIFFEKFLKTATFKICI